MVKKIWREGRITKNCSKCGAQTTGYVDTGKEPYALCINCAKTKGLVIDQIRNRKYSQWAGREKFFEREREVDPDMTVWDSCVIACEQPRKTAQSVRRRPSTRVVHKFNDLASSE